MSSYVIQTRLFHAEVKDSAGKEMSYIKLPERVPQASFEKYTWIMRRDKLSFIHRNCLEFLFWKVCEATVLSMLMVSTAFENEGCQNPTFVLSKYTCEGIRNCEPKSISRVSMRKARTSALWQFRYWVVKRRTEMWPWISDRHFNSDHPLVIPPFSTIAEPKWQKLIKQRPC